MAEGGVMHDEDKRPQTMPTVEETTIWGVQHLTCM
jgi:hypothetical protein